MRNEKINTGKAKSDGKKSWKKVGKSFFFSTFF